MSLSGGNLGEPWNDSIAAYLNGGILEYSLNGSSWIFYATIDGVSDLPGNSKNYYPQVIARYWRITRVAYLAIAEWRFFSEVAEAIIPIELSGEFAELIVEGTESGIAISIDVADLTPEAIDGGFIFAADSTELLIESLTGGLSISATVDEITPTTLILTTNLSTIYT